MTIIEDIQNIKNKEALDRAIVGFFCEDKTKRLVLEQALYDKIVEISPDCEYINQYPYPFKLIHLFTDSDLKRQVIINCCLNKNLIYPELLKNEFNDVDINLHEHKEACVNFINVIVEFLGGLEQSRYTLALIEEYLGKRIKIFLEKLIVDYKLLARGNDLKGFKKLNDLIKSTVTAYINSPTRKISEKINIYYSYVFLLSSVEKDTLFNKISNDFNEEDIHALMNNVTLENKFRFGQDKRHYLKEINIANLTFTLSTLEDIFNQTADEKDIYIESKKIWIKIESGNIQGSHLSNIACKFIQPKVNLKYDIRACHQLS